MVAIYLTGLVVTGLLLQGSPTTVMPAKVVRFDATKLVVSSKGKDHILLLGPGLKVLDPEGQVIAETDLKKLLKVGDGVTVRTARARPEDFPDQKLEPNARTVTEIHLSAKGPSSSGQRDDPNRRRSRDGSDVGGTIAAAEVVKVEAGMLTAKVDGRDRRFGFSLRVRAFDLEGREPKLPAQLLVPGNILELKITAPDPAEVRAGRYKDGEMVITVMRLKSGTLGEIKTSDSRGPGRPEVKRPADMLSEQIAPDLWNTYYKKARVGDFIEYRGLGSKDEPPSRSEVMDVGDNFVIVLTTSYHFGKADHTWRKRVPRLTGGNSPKLPGSGGGRRSEVELTVNGRTLKCVLTESGDKARPDSRKWHSLEVPFDGLVRHEGGGKVIFELVDFGRRD